MAPSSLCCASAKFKVRDITVEPVLFLYMCAATIVFPTLQALAYTKVCYQNFNETFCHKLKNGTFQQQHADESDFIQSTTSHWILLGNMAMTIPACFTAIFFLGPYGDKVGRKLPIILPIIGAIVQSVASLLNAVFMTAPIAWLLVGPLLSGLCGGMVACLMAVFSYLTHIAKPESKTMRIGILESMIYMAGTLGVFVSGVMLDQTSFTFVFGVSMALLCLALVYVIVWLVDLKPSQPGLLVRVGWDCRWMCSSLKEMIEFIKRPRGSQLRLMIFLLVISLDLILFCTMGELDILLLFLRREPLAWSQTLFGYFRGLENLLRGLMLMFGLSLLKQKAHVRDTVLVMGGILSKAMGLVLMSLATKTWLVFVAGVVSMGQGLPGAGLRSMMSSLVMVDEQGRLFSMVAASESLVVVFAALFFNTVYPKTLHFFPGFAFAIAAILLLPAFFVIFYMHRKELLQRETSPAYNTMTEETEADLVEGANFTIASLEIPEDF